MPKAGAALDRDRAVSAGPVTLGIDELTAILGLAPLGALMVPWQPPLDRTTTDALIDGLVARGLLARSGATAVPTPEAEALLRPLLQSEVVAAVSCSDEVRGAIVIGRESAAVLAITADALVELTAISGDAVPTALSALAELGESADPPGGEPGLPPTQVRFEELAVLVGDDGEPCLEEGASDLAAVVSGVPWQVRVRRRTASAVPGVASVGWVRASSGALVMIEPAEASATLTHCSAEQLSSRLAEACGR